MSIKAMRERRTAAAIEARKLMDSTKDKKWEPEHQIKYDELTTVISDLDQRIEREQKVLDLEAETKFDEEMDRIGAKSKHKDLDPLSERAIADVFFRKGERGFSDAQAEKVRNTMSTTTGSEGAYTVQSEVAKTIVDTMKDYSGVRQVATVIKMAKGNAMNYPSTDGTAEEGEQIDENTTATDDDIEFGQVPLNVYKYSSKVITIPIELLMDSEIDVEALVRKRFAERIGRITNKKFTIGTGTSEPKGITVAASVGKTGTTGQTVTIIYDDLVDLVESIDEAYLKAGDSKFMMAQTLRKVIRKIKDTAGRPIWTPGYEFGITAKAPDLLMGHGIQINNHMPTPAANAKSLAFGDFSKYVVRDVLDVSLFRFADSAYVKKGQIGFLAWARCGGNLIDTAAVKTYAHSAS